MVNETHTNSYTGPRLKYFMQFLEISWDFGILEFSKILGFFQRFFGIFDEVYEDFQSNLPLGYDI